MSRFLQKIRPRQHCSLGINQRWLDEVIQAKTPKSLPVVLSELTDACRNASGWAAGHRIERMTRMGEAAISSPHPLAA